MAINMSDSRNDALNNKKAANEEFDRLLGFASEKPTQDVSELSVKELTQIVAIGIESYRQQLAGKKEKEEQASTSVIKSILSDIEDELQNKHLTEKERASLETLKKRVNPITRLQIFDEELAILNESQQILEAESTTLRVEALEDVREDYFDYDDLGEKQYTPVPMTADDLNDLINQDEKIVSSSERMSRKERIARLKRDYILATRSMLEKYNQTDLEIPTNFYNFNVDRLSITSKILIAQLSQIEFPSENLDPENPDTEIVEINTLLGKLASSQEKENVLPDLVTKLKNASFFENMPSQYRYAINRYATLSELLRSFNRIAGETSRNEIDKELLSISTKPGNQSLLEMPVLVLHASDIIKISENDKLTKQQKKQELFTLINQYKDTESAKIQEKIKNAKSLNDIQEIYEQLFVNDKEKISALFQQQIDLCKQEQNDLLYQYDHQKNNLLKKYDKLQKGLITDENISLLLDLDGNLSDDQKEKQISLRTNINDTLQSANPNLKEEILKLERVVQLVHELKEEFKEKEATQLQQYKDALTVKKPSFLDKTRDWLASQFQTSKKLVDVADDAWYAMRGLLGPTIVNQYGSYIVGTASGAVALAETTASAQEAHHALNNVDEQNAVSAGVAGAATAVTAGTALLASALIVVAAFGVPIFGALTTTILPALGVIVPVLMTVTYGIRLIRDAYNLHVAKGEEHEAEEALRNEKSSLEKAKETYQNGATSETRNALLLTQSKVLAHQKVHEAARKERLTAEREVGFAATEFATSAIVSVGIILGTAAIVGVSVATLGIGGLAMSTLVLMVGVSCGFGAKYFQKKDAEADYKYTGWMRDKLVSAATWLGLNKNEPALAPASSISTSAPDNNGYNSAAIQKTLEEKATSSQSNEKPGQRSAEHEIAQNTDPLPAGRSTEHEIVQNYDPLPAGTMKTLTGTGGPGKFAIALDTEVKGTQEKKAPSLAKPNQQNIKI